MSIMYSNRVLNATLKGSFNSGFESEIISKRMGRMFHNEMIINGLTNH